LLDWKKDGIAWLDQLVLDQELRPQLADVGGVRADKRNSPQEGLSMLNVITGIPAALAFATSEPGT
jgi:hypothetical protein